MGQATNAILFYGYSLGKEFEWPSQAMSECPELYYAAKLGVEPPPHGDYNSADWSDYWERKGAVCHEAGCGIDRHCSDGYPIPFVHAKKLVSYRGDETAVVLPDGSEAAMKEQLQRYATTMGLPFHEPQWLLVSYWG